MDTETINADAVDALCVCLSLVDNGAEVADAASRAGWDTVLATAIQLRRSLMRLQATSVAAECSKRPSGSSARSA